MFVEKLQPTSIDPIIVPTVGMTFKDIDGAYRCYKIYAYEVGFPLKKYIEKTYDKWLNCSREGKCGPRPNDTPWMRNKLTGQTQRKAGIKPRKYMMMIK